MLAKDVRHHRKNRRKKTVEDVRSTGLQLTTQDILGFCVIVNVEAFVLVRAKSNLLRRKLTLQPFAAIEMNLNVIGKPCLQTNVHEPVLFVIKVEIEMLAAGLVILQLWISSLGAIPRPIGRPTLQTRPHSDQALLYAFALLAVMSQFFFPDMPGGNGNDALSTMTLRILLGVKK
jgi:hypothetical protein